jgi:hypothetical protein
MTMNTLSKIKFDAGSKNCAGQVGFQETDADNTLLHLYDEAGDQLDSGNGNFPSATWELVEEVGSYDDGDTDEFWNLIAQHGKVS